MPRIFLFFLPLLFLLSACPPAHLPTTQKLTLPSPLTLDQQLALLNARAAAIPSLRTHGDVTLQWLDNDNAAHKQFAEGTLFFQQPTPPAAQPNMLLAGRYLSQDVFELGINPAQYWLIMKTDPKTAWIGPTPALQDPTSSARIPFRPDQVASVLALAPLNQSTTQKIQMYVHDDPPINILQVIHIDDQKNSYTDRYITIDRLTGYITRIALLSPNGTTIATAALTNYRKFAGDHLVLHTEPNTANLPSLPTSVSITYPARQASILLELKDATTKIKNIEFTPPTSEDLHNYKIITPQPLPSP